MKLRPFLLLLGATFKLKQSLLRVFYKSLVHVLTEITAYGHVHLYRYCVAGTKILCINLSYIYDNNVFSR